MGFGKNTKLMMSDYSMKNIADIKDDDALCKAYGLFDDVKYTVTNMHLSEEPVQLYRVSGPCESYEVTGDHVLALICGKDGLKNTLGEEMWEGKMFNITVEEFLAMNEEFRQNVYGYHEKINFLSINPGFGPYEYGVILSYSTYMAKTKEKLGHENLHIPKSYLINGEENRLGLLAGYADGNGEYKDGKLLLTVEDKLTREDFIFLIRSLGFICECNGSSLAVTGQLSRIPTELFDLEDTSGRTYLNQYKIEVEPSDLDVAYSFEVKEDGNHLLFLDDFTVVHV